ncbi:MAG: CopD family protein [Gammaproteobacteria bacterium]
MQWLIAFHVIFVVCWFSGLFYLPRLFVYHADCTDEPGNQRFKIMEHKLYFYITIPSAVLASLFGLMLWLPHYGMYAHMVWLHVKLILVLLLWVFTVVCGYYVKLFKANKNPYSHKFYRYFNEIPSIILVAVVILSFVQP